MKLTLAEPKYLKDSIAIISDLVNEAKFKITSNGVELVAMDPANVAMVVYKLLSSAFVEYDVKETVELGINLSNLKQILRRAKPSDMLTIELKDNQLKIILKGNSTRTFSLPIIEIDEKEQKVPQLTFPITIKTTSTILNEAIEDADIVADSVLLSTDGQTFVVRGEGDLSQANIEIKSGDETVIKADTKDMIKAKYSIEYLKKMIAGSRLSEDVTIYFNKDYPLKIDYKVIDKVLLSFILAPRVESD